MLIEIQSEIKNTESLLLTLQPSKDGIFIHFIQPGTRSRIGIIGIEAIKPSAQRPQNTVITVKPSQGTY